MYELKQLIEEHYMLVGLVGLLGVYFMLLSHGVTGNKVFLKTAAYQYVFLVLALLATTLVLWAFSNR